MNEEQKILSFEECRQQIIELGKFEFLNEKWIPHQKAYTTIFINNTTIKESILYHTKTFPEKISFGERVYNILYNNLTYKVRKCLMCDNEVEFRTVSLGYAEYCCRKCSNSSPKAQEIRKLNYFNKTGYYNPTQNPEVMQKIRNTNLERTGYEYGLQNPEVREKGKETSIKKYGVDNPSKNKDIVKKREGTYFLRTGYRNPSQNPESREKCKQTLIEKTGYDHNFKNPEVKKQREQTWIEHYGVDNPFKSKELMEKVCQERFEKTGYRYSFQDPEFKEKAKQSYFEKTGYFHSSQNPEVQKEKVRSRTKNGKVSYSKISQELFWVIYNTLSQELKDHTYFATLNKEFAKWDTIKESGYFYDFTISSLKIIIEFDGNFWHSIEGVKERDEQKQKFIEDQGFKVIRIKESDYCENKEKIIEYCLKEINILYSQVTNNKMVC